MLEIKDLAAGYDDTDIVVRLPALTLGRGQSCLLQGASGSGKSTLLHAIAGLGPVMRGTVKIDGEDMNLPDAAARDDLRGRKIGIVFQALHLVKSLTVRENVLLSATVTGRAADAARADELLLRLGIEALAEKPAGEISQGQAQRVAIARALLTRPALLLADEPTSSLDDLNAARVAKLLAELAAENGAALVVASHDARITPLFTHVIPVGAAA